uniref:NAD(P)H-hydrate epimerase n=1 Tax=Vaginimicrobium propionicum TaxID=1871034 RepID=UPI000970A4F2|nr:NAD(P)H-hydrate epimerase [Vaginimicrobium propionicum]
MKKVASVAEIRRAEELFFDAHPGVDLMARAAHQVAKAAITMTETGETILVAVGPGNNGGDGLFAAQELAQQGYLVNLWCAFDKAHEKGLEAALAAGARRVEAPRLDDVSLVIDAVFGIGSRPGLPDNVAEFAGACDDWQIPVLSVDIPSGMDADSHLVGKDTFEAEKTVTFGAMKMCHAAAPAAAFCGTVQVADIGFEVETSGPKVIETIDLVDLWPFPDYNSDKYARGVVGIDTGSPRFPGASLLNVTGALHSGAGMIRYVGPLNRELILSRHPSVIFGIGRVNSWVVGSGWGAPDIERLKRRVTPGTPLVVDAEALDLLDRVKLPSGSLLTPHAGELARILGVSREEVEAEPIKFAKQAAERFHSAVLLKGATQYVCDAKDCIIALAGPAWTAQAGSGDVLAGVAGTLLAAKVPPLLAGAMAASVQAQAANLMPGPHPPDEIAHAIADTLGRLG